MLLSTAFLQIESQLIKRDSIEANFFSSDSLS